MGSAADILRALAELAPTGRTNVWNVAAGRPVAQLRTADGPYDDPSLPDLAALDALHRDERLLRRGWGVVRGLAVLNGTTRDVYLPLVSQPVRFESGERGGRRLVPAGDVELTPLITDRLAVAKLEPNEWLPPEHTTPEWVRLAAQAADLPVTEVLDFGQPVPDDRLVVYRHGIVYFARVITSSILVDTLVDWAARPGLDDTALAAVYGQLATEPPDDEPVLSPLPLNAAQTAVVRRARRERVVVVSGPPGNGKSHAVVAAAIDVVDRGGSVLVATQSPHAADVLGELAARYPGPAPVLFGDSERRTAIAEHLGETSGVGEEAIATERAAVTAAQERLRAVTAGVHAALDLEIRAAGVRRWEPLAPALSAELPSLFTPDADLAAARRLADTLDSPVPPGWWRAWRRRRRIARLRRTTGVSNGAGSLRAAIEAAGARQAAAKLAATGGTDLSAVWPELADAERTLAAAVGAAMRARCASDLRWTPEARRAAASLGTALRVGREQRREILAGTDGPALLSVMPLWIGTVADVEDLLPPTPGLFDLVILDEASHIDQVRAAPVLARARRAMVVGDPRQLRFVSFVSTVDVTATLAKYGLDDRADVRRVSAFDLAAGATAVTWLDEHYRSAPHLVEFSARRFYDHRIAVATRHPRNDSADVIDVVRASPGNEVPAVLKVVARLAADGWRSIGVVTPFRAQADALEYALLDRYSLEEIDRLGLRVGTVHAFQGSEADVVVASLGVADGDPRGRLRFMTDPALFNVLVTRARRRMVVVTSLTSPGGVVGDYLRYSERGPAAPSSPSPTGEWRDALATELSRAGVVVRLDYPVGRWTVDLCLGTGDEAFGLLCAVHPDGVEAHVERQLSLVRAGWRLRDAFASRWGGDEVRAALELAPR